MSSGPPHPPQDHRCKRREPAHPRRSPRPGRRRGSTHGPQDPRHPPPAVAQRRRQVERQLPAGEPDPQLSVDPRAIPRSTAGAAPKCHTNRPGHKQRRGDSARQRRTLAVEPRDRLVQRLAGVPIPPTRACRPRTRPALDRTRRSAGPRSHRRGSAPSSAARCPRPARMKPPRESANAPPPGYPTRKHVIPDVSSGWRAQLDRRHVADQLQVGDLQQRDVKHGVGAQHERRHPTIRVAQRHKRRVVLNHVERRQETDPRRCRTLSRAHSPSPPATPLRASARGPECKARVPSSPAAERLRTAIRAPDRSEPPSSPRWN